MSNIELNMGNSSVNWLIMLWFQGELYQRQPPNAVFFSIEEIGKYRLWEKKKNPILLPCILNNNM